MTVSARVGALTASALLLSAPLVAVTPTAGQASPVHQVGHDGHDHGDPVDPTDPSSQPDRAITGPQGGVGQFAVSCGFSHEAADDPIAHPGHPGASHLHQFFGNVTVDAGSTYESLLGADTTCEQPLDTASYWAPALLDGSGDPVTPLGAVAYYRAGQGVEPTGVVAYPPGLKMIAGDANAVDDQPTSVVAWSCGADSLREPRPPACGDEDGPRLLVTFQDCWDGTSLDSSDHRSHVAYSSGGQCPASHPVSVPQLQFAIQYPVVDDPASLSLASGPIVTAHADFWNAWDQDKLEREVTNCIGLQRVCSIASYAGLGTFPTTP